MKRHPEDEERQNKFAYDIKDDIIFIDDAQSGRKGYFCMGCEKEMQAVKSRVVGRASYFRHDAQAVKHSGKCTYSDETYRHKLAKEILQSTKRVKLPPVYKFDTNNIGQAMLLNESTFIDAHHVSIELYFYEDDNGIIKWGKNEEVENRNLIIKPDVTFFNNKNEPILLIEIVATHKPNQDKLLKLMRLGINTISISIPSDSPEAIASIFNYTSRTKWIYNNDEATAQYVQSSNGDSERVPYIDEEQRKLFAESHKCRKAQINNLIRRIGKCLESQQYRSIKQNLESEISRVEGNTAELRTKLDEEEREYRFEADGRDAGTRQQIVEKTRSIENEARDLERRYSAKAREIEGQGELLSARIEETIRSVGGNGKDFDQRMAAYHREGQAIERRIGNDRERLLRIIDDGTYLRQRFESNKRQLIEDFKRDKDKEERDTEGNQRYREQLPAQFERDKQAAYARIGRLKDAEESAIAREQELGNTIPARFEEKEATIRNEFEGLRQSTIAGVQANDFGRNPYLSAAYKDSISQRGLLHDVIEKERIYKRYTTIREFIKSGEHKTWM